MKLTRFPTLARIYNRITSFTNPLRGLIFSGPRSLPGIRLTAYEALRLSVVWACVSVIAKAIASSDWDILYEKPNGDRDYQRNSPIYRLLNVRPNREMTPFAFHETMLMKALIWGESFAEIEFDVVGRPAALWPLDPDRCLLVRGFTDKTGQFNYSWSGELFLRYTNFDKPNTFLPYADVYHIHGMSIDGICGLNMVDVAAKPLLMMMASESFRLKFYQNGATLGGILSTENLSTTEAELDAVKKNIEERVTGVDNAFNFLVLGGGFKWEALTPDFDKAQFIETNYFLIEEACRYWGVPPHKVAHLLRATFSNIEHQGIEFKRDGLKPWAKRCEQEVDYKLLPAGPVSICINLDWAAEGDAKSVAETDAIIVSNGLMTRNAVNRKRGRNSIGPNGDVITIAANMTTLQRVIDGPPTPPPAPAPGAPPNDPNAPDNNPDGNGQANNTARRLFASAIRRTIERQQRRLETNRFPANEALIAKWVERMASANLIFAHEQIANAIDAMDEVGIIVKMRTDTIDKMADEDKQLLNAAFKRGTLENWCNIEERVARIVDEMEIQILSGKG